MELATALNQACKASAEDGCTRYVSARIVRQGITMLVDPNGYRVTDWSDDACVVCVNGRGDWEYTVEQQRDPVPTFTHPEGWKLV